MGNSFTLLCGEMLFHDVLADGSADECGHDHARDQRHGYPRLQHLRCGKDGILTAIGDHLICHSLGCDGVGNDGAAKAAST